MKKFENKVVWITGASSGIGEATAYKFAEEGAMLILSARREEELIRVKNNIHSAEDNVQILPIDLEKLDEIEAKAMEAKSFFGKIDIVFNNAGISQRSATNETSLEVYQKLMNLNFFGVIALTKAVLPMMKQQKAGHVVVTSSVAGKVATPLRSGYCASKHALHGFFDSLRSEVYDDNINVTIICPGYVNTNISYNAVSADGSKYGKLDKNQENGLTVEACADKIVNAIFRKKEEVYIGGKEIYAIYLKRFFPKIFSKIVRKQAPK